MDDELRLMPLPEPLSEDSKRFYRLSRLIKDITDGDPEQMVLEADVESAHYHKRHIRRLETWLNRYEEALNKITDPGPRVVEDLVRQKEGDS